MSLPIESEPGDVIWSGTPDPAATFTAWDAFWIPFGLAWITFCVSIIAVAPSGMRLVAGTLMACIGVYIVGARFFIKRRIKARTRYLLTPNKAIIASSRATHTFDLSSSGVLVRVAMRGGRMQVTFASDPSPARVKLLFNSGFANTGLDIMLRPGEDLPFRFYDVPESQGLRDALHRLSAQSGRVRVMAW